MRLGALSTKKRRYGAPTFIPFNVEPMKGHACIFKTSFDYDSYCKWYLQIIYDQYGTLTFRQANENQSVII